MAAILNFITATFVMGYTCVRHFLNVKKTHFIIFSFSNKRIVNTHDIVIDNQPVSRVSYTKFLDV